MSKRSISAKVLVKHIKNELSDAELMGRHELSSSELKKVLAQLVKGGYVTQEVVDGREQESTEKSSGVFRGSNAPVIGVGSNTPEPSSSVPPNRYSTGFSSSRSPQTAGTQLSSTSLPLSLEEASRVRRNGLILILASYGFLTLGMILIALGSRAESDTFPNNEVGAAIILLAATGCIVTAILGCLWRVRGLGNHAAWAIVAPINFVNLVVVEALPNRYEPKSDSRGLRVAFAVSGLMIWIVALSVIMKLL